MIIGFRDWEAERIWCGTFRRALPHDIQSTALRKLRMLNNAKVLHDLAVPPNNQLEALKGDRTGQHSIRINRQWRICFIWTTGGPDRVEIVDYH
jgi:toxin HigB-1